MMIIGYHCISRLHVFLYFGGIFFKVVVFYSNSRPGTPLVCGAFAFSARPLSVTWEYGGVNTAVCRICLFTL